MNKKVFLIRCYDMGCSNIEGIYDSYDKAEADLLKIVAVVNERLKRRNDEYHTAFMKTEIREDDVDVLVQYRNRIRVMEIMQYELNKPNNEIIDWYDYIPE